MKLQLKKAVVGTPLEPWARGVIKSLRRLGLLQDQEQSIEDRHLVEIMKRSLRSDSNCIDVGCSVGEILDHMIRISPRGSHVAFEPLPHRANDLVKKYPGVEIFNMALSDSQGTGEFHHVVENTGYSGLKRREYPSEDMEVIKIEVRIERLDNVVPERRFDFLKIDVEGAELQVLRGAVETIRRNRKPIAFEHGPGAAEFYGTTPQMLFDFFKEECDYHVSLFSDWLADREALNCDQFMAEYGGRDWNFLAHP